MNIERRLKQLKKILPSREYAARSRAFILGVAQEALRPRLTVWQFVMQNLQIGSAIALTGLLLLLGFGGFSAWKFLSPLGVASLDPANLRAEAEAVRDFQVALNSIQYIPPAPSASPAERMSLKNGAPAREAASLQNATSTENISSPETPASDAFSTTTVNAALDFLLE